MKGGLDVLVLRWAVQPLDGNGQDDECPLYTYYERFVGTIRKLDHGHDPRVVLSGDKPQIGVTKWHGANALARCAKDSICDGGADHANGHFPRTAIARVAGERAHVHVDLPGYVSNTQHRVAVEVTFNNAPVLHVEFFVEADVQAEDHRAL